MDSHSSGTCVTTGLKRPTREPCGPHAWANPMPPYLVLLRMGFTLPLSVAASAVRSYRTISPLPRANPGRYIFCGTFRRLAPPRRYLAPCPMEPGLSSTPATGTATVWPTPLTVYPFSSPRLRVGNPSPSVLQPAWKNSTSRPHLRRAAASLGKSVRLGWWNTSC